MPRLTLEPYTTPEKTAWHPAVVFRTSGVVTDSRSTTDAPYRAPDRGVPFSVYILSAQHRDSGLVFRFGSKLTEGGYLYLDDTALETLHDVLSNTSTVPEWTSDGVPGRLAHTHNGTQKIDGRDIDNEILEQYAIVPVTESQLGVQFRTSGGRTRGANVEFTPKQVSWLKTVLHDYLEGSLGDSSPLTPWADVIEPTGQTNSSSLRPPETTTS